MIRFGYQITIVLDAEPARRIELKRQVRVLIREAIMGSGLSVPDLEITALHEPLPRDWPSDLADNPEYMAERRAVEAEIEGRRPTVAQPTTTAILAALRGRRD